MRPTIIIKWLVGIFAFFLPALTAVIGMWLDKSDSRHDPLYTALIPVAGWCAIVLALIIPAALVLTTRMSLPRRIGLAAVTWALLFVEFYLVFISVMTAHH